MMAGSEHTDNALHCQLSTDPLSPVERWWRLRESAAGAVWRRNEISQTAAKVEVWRTISALCRFDVDLNVMGKKNILKL